MYVNVSTTFVICTNSSNMNEYVYSCHCFVFTQELVWNPYFVDTKFMTRIISTRKPKIIVLGIAVVSSVTTYVNLFNYTCRPIQNKVTVVTS